MLRHLLLVRFLPAKRSRLAMTARGRWFSSPKVCRALSFRPFRFERLGDADDFFLGRLRHVGVDG